MEIAFQDIKPYLRFIRYLELNNTSNYSPVIPYDARLLYTFDGEGIIKVNGQTYHMKKHSLILINSGVEYHIQTPNNYVLFLAINFDFTFSQSNRKSPVAPAIVKEYDDAHLIEHVVFKDATEFNQVLYIESIPSIENKMISMEKEYLRKANMYELKLSATMTEVLVNCFRHIKNPNIFSNDKDLTTKIINYISMNYEKKLTNIDIAHYFNYHPNYISNLVKQYTGYPLTQYINLIRTTKACEMLSFTDESILEIATLCGFYDASHFIKIFKKKIGITPQQYRNSH